MNKTNTNTYWLTRVNKLSLGQSVYIPAYGRITCYQAADGVRGSRRFKLTDVSELSYVAPGGSRTLTTIRNELNV